MHPQVARDQSLTVNRTVYTEKTRLLGLPIGLFTERAIGKSRRYIKGHAPSCLTQYFNWVIFSMLLSFMCTRECDVVPSPRFPDANGRLYTPGDHAVARKVVAQRMARK